MFLFHRTLYVCAKLHWNWCVLIDLLARGQLGFLVCSADLERFMQPETFCVSTCCVHGVNMTAAVVQCMHDCLLPPPQLGCLHKLHTTVFPLICRLALQMLGSHWDAAEKQLSSVESSSRGKLRRVKGGISVTVTATCEAALYTSQKNLGEYFTVLTLNRKHKDAECWG